MHLAGIDLPPLGSVHDRIFRSSFLKQRLRELRDLSLVVLAAQGKAEAVSEIFRDHSEDLLFSEGYRQSKDDVLREQYEEMRRHKPVVHQERDGSLKVTGIR